MTSRWRTCSESRGPLIGATVLLALLPGVLAAAITGSVRLTDSNDSAVRKNKEYGGVVVWLERIGGPPLALQPKAAQMAQKHKRFLPTVLAVPTGTLVNFPNLDPIFHNVFSNFDGQVFDVGLYAPGKDQTVRLTRPGVVRVFCNIHPTMSAVIVVLNSPYMAVSRHDGSFQIEGVEPGEYRLHLFHERATEQTVSALKRNLTVSGEALTLPPLSISESGYIQAAHKNKYGKDYPPIIEDRPMYPGRRP